MAAEDAARELTHPAGSPPVVDGLIVDPAEPARLPEGETAWAAWSAWRGDVPLLAHTVRTAALAVTRADGTPAACFIEVAVRDDVERFRSPADLTQWLTNRAVARFKGIAIAIRGTRTQVDLRIARAPSAAVVIPAYPAVLLEVASEDGKERAASVRDSIVPAVSRGEFAFTFEPRVGLPRLRAPVEPIRGIRPDDPGETLDRRVIFRYVVALGVVLYVLALMISGGVLLLELTTSVSVDLWGILGTAGGFALLAAVAISGRIHAGVADDLRARVLGFGFPAVELRPTPAARGLRIAARLATAAVTSLIGIAVAALIS